MLQSILSLFLIKNWCFDSYWFFSYTYILSISDRLLNLKIQLFFLILSLQLIIFCMDDLKYMAYFEFFFFFLFICITIKINHLYLLSISLSHTLKAFVRYGYVVILSKVYSFLSSLLLSAMLLISSVYLQFGSLLNHCCDFSMVLFLNKQQL